MRTRAWHIAAVTGLFWAIPVQADSTVKDAALLNVDGQLVQLYGIDVPDRRQSCDAGKWFPRPEATAALAMFGAERPVKCFQVYSDPRTSRPVSICYAGQDDLQAFMVGQGWAWVVRPDTLKYINYERQAMALRLGVHGHQCERADRWRRRNSGEGNSG